MPARLETAIDPYPFRRCGHNDEDACDLLVHHEYHESAYQKFLPLIHDHYNHRRLLPQRGHRTFSRPGRIDSPNAWLGSSPVA